MPLTGTKIYLGNLCPKATPAVIRKLFEKYGEVLECALNFRYGFVHMDSPENAAKAIDFLNGHEVFGKRLVAQLSTGVDQKRKNPVADSIGAKRKADSDMLASYKRTRAGGAKLKEREAKRKASFTIGPEVSLETINKRSRQSFYLPGPFKITKEIKNTIANFPNMHKNWKTRTPYEKVQRIALAAKLELSEAQEGRKEYFNKPSSICAKLKSRYYEWYGCGDTFDSASKNAYFELWRTFDDYFFRRKPRVNNSGSKSQNSKLGSNQPLGSHPGQQARFSGSHPRQQNPGHTFNDAAGMNQGTNNSFLETPMEVEEEIQLASQRLENVDIRIKDFLSDYEQLQNEMMNATHPLHVQELEITIKGIREELDVIYEDETFLRAHLQGLIAWKMTEDPDHADQWRLERSGHGDEPQRGKGHQEIRDYDRNEQVAPRDHEEKGRHETVFEGYKNRGHHGRRDIGSTGYQEAIREGVETTGRQEATYGGVDGRGSQEMIHGIGSGRGRQEATHRGTVDRSHQEEIHGSFDRRSHQKETRWDFGDRNLQEATHRGSDARSYQKENRWDRGGRDRQEVTHRSVDARGLQEVMRGGIDGKGSQEATHGSAYGRSGQEAPHRSFDGRDRQEATHIGIDARAHQNEARWDLGGRDRQEAAHIGIDARDLQEMTRGVFDRRGREEATTGGINARDRQERMRRSGGDRGRQEATYGSFDVRNRQEIAHGSIGDRGKAATHGIVDGRNRWDLTLRSIEPMLGGTDAKDRQERLLENIDRRGLQEPMFLDTEARGRQEAMLGGIDAKSRQGAMLESIDSRGRQKAAHGSIESIREVFLGGIDTSGRQESMHGGFDSRGREGAMRGRFAGKEHKEEFARDDFGGRRHQESGFMGYDKDLQEAKVGEREGRIREHRNTLHNYEDNRSARRDARGREYLEIQKGHEHQEPRGRGNQEDNRGRKRQDEYESFGSGRHESSYEIKDVRSLERSYGQNATSQEYERFSEPQTSHERQGNGRWKAIQMVLQDLKECFDEKLRQAQASKEDRTTLLAKEFLLKQRYEQEVEEIKKQFSVSDSEFESILDSLYEINRPVETQKRMDDLLREQKELQGKIASIRSWISDATNPEMVEYYRQERSKCYSKLEDLKAKIDTMSSVSTGIREKQLGRSLLEGYPTYDQNPSASRMYSERLSIATDNIRSNEMRASPNIFGKNQAPVPPSIRQYYDGRGTQEPPWSSRMGS